MAKNAPGGRIDAPGKPGSHLLIPAPRKCNLNDGLHPAIGLFAIDRPSFWEKYAMLRRLSLLEKAMLPGLVGLLLLCAAPSSAEPILGDQSFQMPSGGPANQQQLAQDALDLFKSRDFEGSLKLWREACKKNPDLPPAQLIMAQLYLQAGMLNEGKDALKKTIDEAPSDPESYLFLARVNLGEKKVDEAKANLKKAEELLASYKKNAKRKEVLQSLLLADHVNFAIAQKDWPAAVQTLETMVKANPKNVDAWQKMGFCLFQQDKIDDALAKLREINKVAPAAPVAEAILSDFYDKAGDVKNSQKWIDEAVKTAPDNLRTRMMAGYHALYAGQFEAARQQAIAAGKIDQKSLDAKLLQALIATYERNYLIAELLYNEALKQSPDNWMVMNNLAMVLIEQEDPAKKQKALEYAEANFKRLSKLPQAASTYGYILYRLGRLEDAEKVLPIAKPIAATDLDTAYILARVAVDRGRKEEARQLIEEALKNTKTVSFRQESEDLLKSLDK